MPFVPVSRPAVRNMLPQAVAILLCIALGFGMILNTQMGGEAMWFWYATLFHQGTKLYSGMHIPLQPLFLLLTNAWMQIFGKTCIAYESQSLLEVFALCCGLYFVLRESDWPGWQKAILLAGCFVTTVLGSSYRFDDYHVITENLILYSFLLLLILSRTESPRHQLLLTAALGVLCGLTITSRITDGAALVVASSVSILVLSRSRKLLTLGLFLVVTAAVVLLVVKLTGDSFSDYVSNTLFKAAGSKGGTGSIFAAPLLFLSKAFYLLRSGGKTILVWMAALIAVGFAAQRLWKLKCGNIFLLQMALAAITYALNSPVHRNQYMTGTFSEEIYLVTSVIAYVLAPVIAMRFAMSGAAFGRHAWDCREILLLLPLGEWASYSVGAAGDPHTGYYAPIALLVLLVAATQSFRKLPAWANASIVTTLALLAITGTAAKIKLPYSWQHYIYKPMFENRVWYRHPVYGPLYIDRDLLEFSQAVCTDIHAELPAQPGAARPELLSMPYAYPNYFCDTPPWGGYVQTFFDTSTRPTIEHLMQQLDTTPPQWIVYQRQLDIMSGAERLYNHGQPIAQRDLDTMILRKLSTGQWQLIEKRNYLEGDGWYIIKTHP